MNDSRAQAPIHDDPRVRDATYKLWSRLMAADIGVHLDRWLSRELGGLHGWRRPQRLWIGEQILDGVRFAALALWCDHLCGQPPARLDDDGIAAAVRPWADAEPDPLAMWQWLRALPPAALFFWVFLRKRHAGHDLPHVGLPHPQAMDVWKAVRAWGTTSTSPQARLLWAGVPPWLAPQLERRAQASGWTDADAAVFLERLATRPPLWLRLVDASRRAEVVDELTGAGFSVVGEDVHALAVRGPRSIEERVCVREGAVVIQDLASQHIGRAVAAEPGQFVWDVCAGRGGKTLQVAAAMDGRGAVYATDINAVRLDELRTRARRAGYTSVRAHVWDGRDLPRSGVSVHRHGGFDRVLVDAPCSGSGTWRRNLEGRLRVRAGDLGELSTRQRQLLDVAAKAVRTGGRLVYATCSWFCEENEDVVASFLAAQPEFTLVSQDLHGSPGQDADTTFTAVFVRNA